MLRWPRWSGTPCPARDIIHINHAQLLHTGTDRSNLSDCPVPGAVMALDSFQFVRAAADRNSDFWFPGASPQVPDGPWLQKREIVYTVGFEVQGRPALVFRPKSGIRYNSTGTGNQVRQQPSRMFRLIAQVHRCGDQ